MPSTSALPTREQGYVVPWSDLSRTTMGGLGGWPGDLTGEETPEMAWPYATAVYDRMRRQDSQVRGVFWALTLPLRRPAMWALDPRDAPPEVVNHIADDLDLPILGQPRAPAARRQGRFSWLEHVRLALLGLVFGHMPFEVVYRIDDDESVHLRKLAPRFPSTLSSIDVARDGGLVSIRQWPMQGGGSQSPAIDVDRLVMYVVDREGGNWIGSSVLRSSYKDWLLKDRLLRTNAMSIERTGMGVPVIEAPERATATQMSELSLMAQNYRAGESAGGALPHGAKLNLVGITGSVPDALPSIAYHDTQIAKGMLQEFRQLGTDGNSGNRALGQVFWDTYTLALDSFAGGFLADTTTQHVVEDLVDANWGPDVPAPAVVARAVDAERDVDPAAILSLVQAGALTPDDDLEDWLRDRYSLPVRGGASHLPTAPTTVTPTTGPAMSSRRRSNRVAAARPSRTVHAVRATQRRFRSSLESYFSGPVADALSGLANPRAILDAWTAPKASTDSDARRRARDAVDAQEMDDAELADTLSAIYGESFVAGGHSALDAVPGTPTLPLWDGLVDWSNWTPGDTALAVGLALSARPALSDLAASASNIAAGILSTTADRLVDALVEGFEADESPGRLLLRLESVLDDGSRVDTIVATEVARGMAVGATDTYRVNAIEAREWVALDNPCPECEAMDGKIAALDEPFPDMGSVPGHVSCRCSEVPASLPVEGAA